MTGIPGTARVMKFGGSSLAGLARVRRAAHTVAAAAEGGRPVVVVVSARGSATDDLLAEAHRLSSRPAARELDQLLITGETASAALLAMALNDVGAPAVSLSGAQTGISVRGPHAAGRIEAVAGGRISAALCAGQIAVVAGFHGLNTDGDIVTLGRGGSDTTAVALAVALGAPSCDIYTDVDGVFTADPRVVPAARLIPAVHAAVMAEMAYAGARVLHSRSAHLANRFGVDIHVRNSAHDGPRTVVRAAGNGEGMLETSSPLVGIAHADGMARVVVHAHGPRPDGSVAFLTELAAHAIPVDVVTSVHDARFGLGLDVTLPAGRLATVLAVAARLGYRCAVTRGVAKVSLLGSGLLDHLECTARMLSTLDRAGIRVHSVAMSQLRCAVTIEATRLVEAVRLLHDEFAVDLGAPAELTTVGAQAVS